MISFCVISWNFFHPLILILISSKLKSQSKIFPVSVLLLIQYVALLSNLIIDEPAALKVAGRPFFQMMSGLW